MNLLHQNLNVKFPIHYELTNQGLPPSVMFDHSSFIRPSQRSNKTAHALMTNAQTPPSNPHTIDSAHVPVINDTNTGDCFKRDINLHHIK